MQDRTGQLLAPLVDRLRQEFPELISVYRFGSFGSEYYPSLPVEVVAGTSLVLDIRETVRVPYIGAVQSPQGVGVHVLGTNNVREERLLLHGYEHASR